MCGEWEVYIRRQSDDYLQELRSAKGGTQARGVVIPSRSDEHQFQFGGLRQKDPLLPGIDLLQRIVLRRFL